MCIYNYIHHTDMLYDESALFTVHHPMVYSWRPGRRPWPWTRRCVGPVYPSDIWKKGEIMENHGFIPAETGKRWKIIENRAALGVVYILMLGLKQQKLSIWRNDAFGQFDPQRVWNWERCRWTTGCDQSCRWNSCLTFNGCLWLWRRLNWAPSSSRSLGVCSFKWITTTIDC